MSVDKWCDMADNHPEMATWVHDHVADLAVQSLKVERRKRKAKFIVAEGGSIFIVSVKVFPGFCCGTHRITSDSSLPPFQDGGERKSRRKKKEKSETGH